MKISAKGPWPLADIASKLAAVFDSMAASGIDSVMSTTLYINPYSNGRPTHFLAERGKPVETLELIPTRLVYKPSFVSMDRLATELDGREYLATLRSEADRVAAFLAEMDGRDRDT